MKGECKCNTITLIEFYNSSRQLLNYFNDITIVHLYKGENNEANQLTQHAYGYKKLKDEALESTVKEYCIMEIELADPWQQEIIDCLQKPSSKAEFKLKQKAMKYTMIEEVLTESRWNMWTKLS